MTKNPFNGQHDSSYQSWKNLAGISQAMSSIEAELQKLYSMAAGEPTRETPTLALAAPSTVAPLEVLSSIDVTDVVAKRSPRKFKGAEKTSKTAAKKSIKGIRSRAKRTGNQDNTAKVLAHLQTILSDQTFTKLNQSSIAIAIGLPKGSIGASVKKLINDGKLVQGQGKEFKLIAAA
jgi:hypothetical protein